MYLLREWLASMLFFGLLFAVLGLLALLAIAARKAGRGILSWFWRRTAFGSLASSGPSLPGVPRGPDSRQAPASTL